MSSILSADGFFAPLMYWANRLCAIPIRLATADAFSSGCSRNISYTESLAFL